MLKIEHSICPACSVGCGLNIISKDDTLVGIHPYKNHEINEGRNCNNCTDNINNYKNKKEQLNQDYETLINEVINEIKQVNNDKITILTSGKTDNEDLTRIIEFKTKHNYNLITYEDNFTKIESNLIPSYEEIEKANTIITVGDIFRHNSLIARRIIHAKKNGCTTINIHTHDNLTKYSSDKFIKIDSFSEVANTIKNQEITTNTIVIINKIDSQENYKDIIDIIQEKNMKILPVLKNPNSYSFLEKTNPSTIHDLTDKLMNSSIIILINENPAEYLEKNIFQGKKVISINSLKQVRNADITIPVKAWYEKTGSFTNTVGTTQEFIDTVQNKQNNLKTITEVINQIDDGLN